MKRLLLILTMLISGVVSSQSFDFNCEIPFPDSFYLLDFESETILEDITDVFFEDYGVSNHNWVLKLSFITEDTDIAGSAQPCWHPDLGVDSPNGAWINIRINTKWWNQFNDLQKLFLMYHELGHDVLFLGHITDRKGEIMTVGGFSFTPDNYPYGDLETFQRARARMFNNYNQIDYECDGNDADPTGKSTGIVQDIFMPIR